MAVKKSSDKPKSPQKRYVLRLYENGKTRRDQFETFFYTAADDDKDAKAKCLKQYPKGIIISCLEEEL
jgi:hypothetical protein